MQTASPDSQPDNVGPLPPICRSQHQNWVASLGESEREIDQLLSVLAELPTTNYRSLRHRAVEYALTLTKLKSRIHRLRIDVACQSDRCLKMDAPRCTDPRFMICSTGGALLTGVSTEYDRVKANCQAFLSELMGLNLL